MQLTQTALSATDVRKSLSDIGHEQASVSPQALSDSIKRDVAKWKKVVRDAGSPPE